MNKKEILDKWEKDKAPFKVGTFWKCANGSTCEIYLDYLRTRQDYEDWKYDKEVYVNKKEFEDYWLSSLITCFHGRVDGMNVAYMATGKVREYGISSSSKKDRDYDLIEEIKELNP